MTREQAATLFCIVAILGILHIIKLGDRGKW